MAHLLASRYVAVATFATASHALSDARIPLTSSIHAKKPTSVLVHGLDSSKETWTSTLAAMQSRCYPCLALDLRGHGESPLGAVDEFSSEALARDAARASNQPDRSHSDALDAASSTRVEERPRESTSVQV